MAELFRMVAHEEMLLDKVNVPLIQHSPSFLVTVILPDDNTLPEKLV